MRPVLSAAAIAALLAVPAAAQAPAPAWTVDKAKSSLAFRATASGQAFQGRFTNWDARIAFDPKNLAGSRATVTVQVASASTGDKERDELLPEGAFFAAARHPTATFTTRSITSSGGSRYVAVGDLTLKGVKRPVTLPFTLAINGDTARMNGMLVLDRTAFGVGTGQWASNETVSTKVTVAVDLTARRAR
jgi:polyisoprenoid-binding protein YceI